MQLQFPPEHPLIIARTQVTLPKGAFIRALPFVVDETQRFRVDAMVMCAEIMASAYVQMIGLALGSKWEETQNEELRSGHLDIAMFQHAWSMVDQIYSLRLLLRSLAFSGDDVDAFMSATRSAHGLRNRTDHLDQRIPNIAASKDNSRSLFGSLSYFVRRLARRRSMSSPSLNTRILFGLPSNSPLFECRGSCECLLATLSWLQRARNWTSTPPS
jgi:hypothetical protein